MLKARWLSAALLVVTGLLISLRLSSCRLPVAIEAAKEAAKPAQLTVSAAASLRNALEEIETVYTDSQPADGAVSITYNFGASGALAQQIIQGAPVDVFLSASTDWVDLLEQQLFIDERVDLVQNSLVLVVPASSTTAGINGFQDLRSAQIKRVALGEPNSVPAGRYAEEVLAAMGLSEVLQQRLVFGKSVRQVLAYVETSSVDAGLVYLTDARVSGRVRIVAEASAEDHSPIVYSAGVVAADEPAALDFIQFLTSDAAMAIFQQYGFAKIR